MSLTTVLLAVLVVLLVGALPVYPYSAGWGYAPSGILVFVLILLVLFALL
jgi:hypothetical protein